MNEDAKHRAREAHRLMNEPLLVEALDTVRMNALLALSSVDATDAREIYKYQAIVACTSELKSALENAILEGGGLDGGEDPEETSDPDR